MASYGLTHTAAIVYPSRLTNNILYSPGGRRELRRRPRYLRIPTHLENPDTLGESPTRLEKESPSGMTSPLLLNL